MLVWRPELVRNAQDLLTQLEIMGVAKVKWTIILDRDEPEFQDIVFLSDKKREIVMMFGPEMEEVLNTLSDLIDSYGIFELDVESGVITRSHLIYWVIKKEKLKEPNTVQVDLTLPL